MSLSAAPPLSPHAQQKQELCLKVIGPSSGECILSPPRPQGPGTFRGGLFCVSDRVEKGKEQRESSCCRQFRRREAARIAKKRRVRAARREKNRICNRFNSETKEEINLKI